MEYDRALYRVYERIIEDLNMSSNPMETPPPPPPSSSTVSGSIYSPSGNIAVRYDGAPSSPSSVHSRSSLRRRRRRRVMSAEEDGTQDDGHSSSGVNNATSPNQEEAVPPSSPTGSINNSSRRRRRRRQAARQNRVMLQQQQQQQQLSTRRGQSQPLPLPFIMPIWMAKKLDVMNSTRSGSGNNNLVASPRATNNDGYITDAWRSLRNVLLLGRGGATYESVSTTAQQLSLPSGYSPGSLSNHRDSDDNFQSTPPRDVEELQLGVEELSLPMLEESSPSSRSSEGLRRRSPSSPSTPRRSSPRHSASSSPSRRTSPPSIPNSPNLSQSSSTSSSSTSSGGERAAPLSPPTVSLTQRAIQLQMRQAQLHSRGSSEMQNDSDSESYDSADESVNDDSEHDSASSTSSDSDAENEERNDAGCSRKNVYGMMRLSFAVGVFHIFVLVALHVTYVGPYAFRKPGLSGFMERMSARRSLASDLDNLDNPGSRGAKFLRKLLEREEKKDIAYYPDHALINCISYALSTRPENERSKYFAMFGDSDSKRRKLRSVDDDIGDDDFDLVELVEKKYDAYGIPRHHRKMIESETETETKSEQDGAIPFLGKDEILQIKIMYGGICTGQCSQVRHVDYQNKTLHQDDIKVRMLNQGSQRGLSFLRARKIRNIFGDDIYSSPSYWDEPHYRFAMDDALLYLDEKSALMHNITNVNITVTERCLSTGRDDGKLTFLTAVGEFFSQIYGMDSVIINQLMYGIRGSAGSLQSGYLLNSATKERWGWTKQQLEAYEGNDSVVDWFFKKLGALILSFLAFFLVTTVTSLIVRVLTSSGVALMFPLFSFFRRMGMSGADERILAMSYPWIGIAHTAIRNRNIHPQSHLIWAHLAKILLYYIMYEACQAAWSVVLYAKSIPESLPVWIYGMAMILEYFSMVFVRSALSAHFFPRICLIYLMAYHLYFYSVPYGFFDVALIPLFSFLVHSMMYTILAFECVCVDRGIISVETPREVYNKLSWPEWSAQLPSEWTMFLPLNARHLSMHETERMNRSFA